jgi:hypothetical protein
MHRRSTPNVLVTRRIIMHQAITQVACVSNFVLTLELSVPPCVRVHARHHGRVRTHARI